MNTARQPRPTAKRVVRQALRLVPARVRTVVRTWAASLYHLARQAPDPISTPVGSPLEVQYRTAPQLRYVYDVPVSELAHTDVMRAWVTTLRINHTHGPAAARQHLADWFATTAPATVGDVVGLPATTPYLAGEPLTATWPWSAQLPPDAHRDRRQIMEIEAAENGLDSWDMADGWRSFGPAGSRLVDLELRRLTQTYDSIERNGFDREQGTILGRVRQRDDDILVLPFHGWHRTAALLALGWDTVPMRFSRNEPVVRRSDAPWWPNVVNGLYRLDQAYQIFDRQFVALSLADEASGHTGPIHTY